jgi:hypothetical protein
MVWTTLAQVSSGSDITSSRTNLEKDNFDFLKAMKLEFAAAADQGKKFKAATFSANVTSGQLQTQTAVPFGVTFATVPVVCCQILQNPSSAVFWEVIARTATGFTIEVGKISLIAFGASGSYSFAYFAVG